MPVTRNRVIKGITPSLQWLSDLLSFFQVESIRIPSKYREQVLEVKRLLQDDPSGLTNSLLDFAISSATVDYTIETDNKNLTKALNDWLDNLNNELRTSVPTGIKALAKEYFRERWKGSSHLVLRTFWKDVDGLMLPTIMFFVDGEDIKVDSKSNDGVVRLGDEQYFIKVGDPTDMSPQVRKKDIALPQDPDTEVIFVQKPFESWGTQLPVPFLIKRGVYRNSKFLQLMSSKGEYIVGRALEYLLIMKKGTERLALDAHISYDENDLRKANEDLKEIVARKRTEPGFPSMATNFDTDISEYIPDYQKALNQSLYAPIEIRILAGLGFMDVVASVQSNARRESVLNPKPFMGEIQQGIEDFKSMLNDVIQEIIERNKSRKKWMSARIKIVADPIKQMIDNDAKVMMRSLYDRGLLSKKTAIELLGDVDFDFEVQRRETEAKDKIDELLFPPVIQNIEGAQDQNTADPNPSDKKKTNPGKSGPEAKNFTKAELEKIVEERLTSAVKILEQAGIETTRNTEELTKKKLALLEKQTRLLDKLNEGKS